MNCPALTNRKDAGAGYSTLAEDLEGFRNIVCLPDNLNIKQLDEGSAIEKNLGDCSASWHKSCRSQCDKIRIIRAEKRKSAEY